MPPLWDVLYAVDASTSMRESLKPKSGGPFTKVEGVKEGIAQVVARVPLPYGARIGVMAFRAPTKALGMVLDSSKDIIQHVLSFTPVNELAADPALLRGKLDSLQVGGATPTGEALLRAIDVLSADSDAPRKRIKKLVMVTDDKSNVGVKPEALLDVKLLRKAIVDVVWVGSGGDRKALELLASRSGGKFFQAWTQTELAVALNPRIPYVEHPPASPLLEEAERVSAVLKETDRASASYAGIEAAARAVRGKLDRKLQEAVSLEGQARGELDLVISAARNDPKWPTMYMREYADRVWSRGADLSRFQGAAERYRQALKAFP